jgi:hypothetical protein
MNDDVGKRAVFGEILKDYRAQLKDAWSGIDFEVLGVKLQSQGALVPFFGEDYLVDPETGFSDPAGHEPSHATCVALSKYLLINADQPGPTGQEWVSFKQFPDAAPFVEGFDGTVERRISREFAGHGQELVKACEAQNGWRPEVELSYDLIYQFQALPRLPLLLLFNDEEDSFPAQCSVLLRQDAGRYLDMECLAILGITLAARLYAHLQGKDAGELVG